MSPVIKGYDTSDFNALCCGPVWLAMVKAGCPSRCSGCHTSAVVRAQLKKELFTKDCVPSQRSFLLIGHGTTNWTRRSTGVRGKHHVGRRDQFRRVSCWTHVQATRWIIDNDESRAVIDALTIVLSSRSTVALGRLLPF